MAADDCDDGGVAHARATVLVLYLRHYREAGADLRKPQTLTGSWRGAAL